MRTYLALCLVCSFASSTTAKEFTVTVNAGDADRAGTPVSVNLPAELRDVKNVTVVRVEDGKILPAQVEKGTSPRLWWVISQPLKAKQQRRYKISAADNISPSNGRKDASRVSIAAGAEKLTVKVGQRPALTYNMGVVPSPDPKQPIYARSGFIHPVYTPEGKVVTGSFCPDHMHQYAIWFAWTNTEFDGHKVDFWNTAAKSGKIKHVELLAHGGGPVFGYFAATLRHVDITGEQPWPVLTEKWHVRVYNVADGFVFDIHSTQTCTRNRPLEIKKYHYGGMGIRTRMDWNHPSGDFLTSEGKTRADGNHTRPRWVEVHGKIDGDAAGITVMQHPQNFRYPQPARLHPKFGYFSFSPMVLGDFTIKPGDEYVSRYRYHVHDGQLSKDKAESLWHDFAHPPEVQIEGL